MREEVKAVITAVVFVAVFAIVTWVLVTFDTPSEWDSLPPSSLDAVQYAAPSFTSDGTPCYKVMDRTTEQVWWLVHVGGEWVALEVK